MKKLLCLLLALVMILSLVACDKKEEEKEDKGKKTTQTEEKDKGEDKEEPKEEEEKEEEAAAASYEDKLDLYIHASCYVITEEEFNTLLPEGVDVLTYEDYLEGMEGVEEANAETYGEDYVVYYEVAEETPMDENNLAMILMALGLDAELAGDSYDLEVEITMSGSEYTDEEPEMVIFMAVFYDGDWFILSM